MLELELSDLSVIRSSKLRIEGLSASGYLSTLIWTGMHSSPIPLRKEVTMNEDRSRDLT